MQTLFWRTIFDNKTEEGAVTYRDSPFVFGGGYENKFVVPDD